MERFLSDIHKRLSVIAGDICFALTLKRVAGGKTSMRRWAIELREIADKIDEFLSGH